MSQGDSKKLEGDAPSASSSSDGRKERIIVPAILAGLVGGVSGLLSKHRKVHGLANISATYATNLSIVTACYCGGQRGALRYSVIFAVVGTTVDYATLRLAPIIRNFRESHKDGDWLKLPEWSPIQVLDEEALAEKKAREQKLYAQTQQALGKLRKEES
ncbi:uncharacterized protein LOC102630447 isoform X2 [Citrus sinensis]|uniref:uncharacterized protein LOC102630447 isoform X2 n=1 Tax=Citrus sinensis TaxID=2711 RepID=UPI002278B154|nr:uncharacterized protein LOC102630447 isoform X2 [Citrus sinensis]